MATVDTTVAAVAGVVVAAAAEVVTVEETVTEVAKISAPVIVITIIDDSR